LPKALIQLRRLHGDPTDGGDPTARLHVSIRFYHHKLNARKGFSFRAHWTNDSFSFVNACLFMCVKDSQEKPKNRKI
jgi:hypothetical protein